MSMNPQMRIGGLGSGMDVASTIGQIMELEGRRVEKLRLEQDLNNERIGAWIDIKENLSGLTRASDTLRGMDVWRRMTAESSNSFAVRATASHNADINSYAIHVNQLAHAHTIASSSGLKDTSDNDVTATTKLVDIDGINEGDTFEIGGVSFSITVNTTLNSLRSEINNAAPDMDEDQRVRASILDNRLVLQREKTGADEIVLSDNTGNALQTLGLTLEDLDEFGNPVNELLSAQNALFTVQGASVERSSNMALTDVLEGVTLNLYEEGSTTLTIGKDTASIKAAIQTFIDEYNHAQEVVEGYAAIDRTDPSRPTPGLLHNDYLSRDIMYKLRGKATQWMRATHHSGNASYSYNGNQGIMDSLQHIGIWTTGESNRLAIIDEDRLDAMLEQHPDLVENLFRGVPSETNSGVREGGVALDMYRTTRDYTNELDGWIDVRIERIDDEVLRQEDRIERLIRELEMQENSLWRQFGAMDEAIGRMQSGMQYLLGQIGQPPSPGG